MRQMFQFLCVKFLNKLPQGTPAAAKPAAAAAKPFQIAEETSSPATSRAKGKAKMAEPDSESEASSENEGKGSPETHTIDVTPPPAKSRRPRKQD
ncbi:hypothetical protein PCANC_17576 [Puccinia coronata f. sp. avenae]|uniref:Uncharacterized protein n=1 Tax=Puccinia coronata f. sp. avenae TaxID=200324 RepID=A0A2N5VMY7_9BASI|nr:hypothetical protein PCASD_18456 [Puccinia coronata f. sp. avenae]PLW51354.1 hypothetical protein PCANC_17576 [Puccinia coronata f. sp. avenae]